jgi:hypothetical protein
MKHSTSFTVILMLLFSSSVFGAVQLNFLTATQSSSYIQIDWESSTEINNDYYTLERSTDSINYISIATVTGAGSSSSASNYSINDVNVVASQTYYYRLISTELNGSTETLDNIMITTTATLGISAISNTPFAVYSPTSNYLIISGLTEAYNLTIYNTAGQLLYADNDVSEQSKRVDIRGFTTGVYFIQIGDNSYKFIKR